MNQAIKGTKKTLWQVPNQYTVQAEEPGREMSMQDSQASGHSKLMRQSVPSVNVETSEFDSIRMQYSHLTLQGSRIGTWKRGDASSSKFSTYIPSVERSVEAAETIEKGEKTQQEDKMVITEDDKNKKTKRSLFKKQREADLAKTGSEAFYPENLDPHIVLMVSGNAQSSRVDTLTNKTKENGVFTKTIRVQSKRSPVQRKRRDSGGGDYLQELIKEHCASGSVANAGNEQTFAPPRYTGKAKQKSAHSNVRPNSAFGRTWHKPQDIFEVADTASRIQIYRRQLESQRPQSAVAPKSNSSSLQQLVRPRSALQSLKTLDIDKIQSERRISHCSYFREQNDRQSEPSIDSPGTNSLADMSIDTGFSENFLHGSDNKNNNYECSFSLSADRLNEEESKVKDNHGECCLTQDTIFESEEECDDVNESKDGEGKERRRKNDSKQEHYYRYPLIHSLATDCSSHSANVESVILQETVLTGRPQEGLSEKKKSKKVSKPQKRSVRSRSPVLTTTPKQDFPKRQDPVRGTSWKPDTAQFVIDPSPFPADEKEEVPKIQTGHTKKRTEKPRVATPADAKIDADKPGKVICPFVRPLTPKTANVTSTPLSAPPPKYGRYPGSTITRKPDSLSLLRWNEGSATGNHRLHEQRPSSAKRSEVRTSFTTRVGYQSAAESRGSPNANRTLVSSGQPILGWHDDDEEFHVASSPINIVLPSVRRSS